MSNYSITIEDYQVQHGIRVTGTVWFWNINGGVADISSIEIEDPADEFITELSAKAEDPIEKALFLKLCDVLGDDFDFQTSAYEVYQDAA